MSQSEDTPAPGPGAEQTSAEQLHELAQELNFRLEALWCYDQLVSDTGGELEESEPWRELKHEEFENIRELQEFIEEGSQEGGV